jgi:Tfp pilus assembly protein PilO
MDDRILNEIKTKILEAVTLQELQIYTTELQKRIDFLRPQVPDTNNVFINILEATTLQELQIYTVQLRKRINFLNCQFKSKPPYTSQVFSNHFC